jgi:hypothetical protein
MDRKQLLDRKQRVMSDYQMVLGHLQEIDFWLEQEDEVMAAAATHPLAEAATNEQRETATMPRPRRRSAP